MKYIKRIAALLLSAWLCLCLLPASFAEERETLGDELLDELLLPLLEEYYAPKEDVYLGCMNLVTGEEHYWQPDKFVIAASMYKVPLNMVYLDQMASGELVWEEKFHFYKYEELLERSIVDSNNEAAGVLWSELGTYEQYRAIIAPYMGIDVDTVDPGYFSDNRFSPRSMIHCLKLLYEGRDGPYAPLIEMMQKADPERFFREKEQRFHIAQKYGYVPEFSSYFTNCCAIAFTDEPVALVMFTRSLPYPEDLMTAFCTAFCDYTNEQAALRRLAAEKPVADQLVRESFPDALRMTLSPVVKTTDNLNQEVSTISIPVIPCVGVAVLALAAIVILIAAKRKYRFRIFWMVLSVIVLAAALLLCVIGSGAGTLYARPEGDPSETAEAFLTALTAGNYDTAYGFMKDYSSLGLETEPTTEIGKTVYDAVRKSFDYSFAGDCRVDKLVAVQPVRFRYLALSAIDPEDVSEKAMTELESAVQSRPREEVYDENDHYLPEVANEAYTAAVNALLAEPERYYDEVEFELRLEYADGRWQVVAAPELLNALSGGTGGHA